MIFLITEIWAVVPQILEHCFLASRNASSYTPLPLRFSTRHWQDLFGSIKQKVYRFWGLWMHATDLSCFSSAKQIVEWNALVDCSWWSYIQCNTYLPSSIPHGSLFLAWRVFCSVSFCLFPIVNFPSTFQLHFGWEAIRMRMVWIASPLQKSALWKTLHSVILLYKKWYVNPFELSNW